MYFDELGPPWPKHACTDRSVRAAPGSGDHEPTVGGPQWEREGWKPFVLAGTDGDLTHQNIRGHIVRGERLSLWCRRRRTPLAWLEKWTEATPIYATLAEGWGCELATFVLERDGVCREIIVRAERALQM